MLKQVIAGLFLFVVSFSSLVVGAEGDICHTKDTFAVFIPPHSFYDLSQDQERVIVGVVDNSDCIPAGFSFPAPSR